MQVLQFIAPDAASALARIHQQLGPRAVVLSVRRLPAQGLSRLLHKQNRIEVLAGVPDSDAAPKPNSVQPGISDATTFETPPAGTERWRSVEWLVAMGLLPECADKLQHALELHHGSVAADSLDDEWKAVHASLNSFWATAPAFDSHAPQRPHVFIGTPGSGKTTALCKWLTITVLTQERCARVYRLDSDRANTADCLSVHCEMLGAAVERFWTPTTHRAELLFVDFPGVEATDARGLAELRNQISLLPQPHVHLVLNAAYESRILLNQLSAFGGFQPEDLILTHLDEERRRVKLWNLLLYPQSPIPLRYVSGGQRIPGEFAEASPHWLLPVGE